MPHDPSLPGLTPAARKAVVKAVSDGLTYEHAAALAGVSVRLLYYWLRAGRAGSHPEAVQLVQAIKTARAKGVAARVRRINAAAKKHWQADAWFLERTAPEHFGTDRKQLRELRKMLAQLLDRIARLEAARLPPPAESPTAAGTEAPAPGSPGR